MLTAFDGAGSKTVTKYIRWRPNVETTAKCKTSSCDSVRTTDRHLSVEDPTHSIQARCPPAALNDCTQRPWPYLNCVGTPVGNPRIRLITTDKL
jgi:hypothetical protein